MLIQFRVENYKSFDKEQKLSLIAGSPRNNAGHTIKVGSIVALRTAAIFGANASGKSNLIKAMSAIQQFVLYGIPIPLNDCCRVSEGNRDRTSSFEFTMSIGDDIYAYGIEMMISTGDVKSEWLRDLSKGRAISIFERRNEDITSDLVLKEDRKYFDVYGNEAKAQTRMPFLLILARMPQGTREGLDAVHRVKGWFMNGLRIIVQGVPPNFTFTNRTNTFSRTILPAYGTGVSDIAYGDLNSKEKQFPPGLLNAIIANRSLAITPNEPIGVIDGPNGRFPVFMNTDGSFEVKKLMFEHNGVRYKCIDESDGTNRLYELAPILDPADGTDLTYVIDELDRSLHPQVTKRFVNDFESLDSSLRRQLIITTHESRLLDLNLLRRDEIWFVEKDNERTTIFALEEFKERIDRDVNKAYLEGRYGATPCFKNIHPDLERR